jgi:hypothetical protein
MAKRTIPPVPPAHDDDVVTVPAMASASASLDVVQAKQVLSNRLLRNGLRGGVMARRGGAISVAAAVAAASRNVHAVGVGRKVVDGKVTDQRAVRIYVVQKLAPSLLPPADRLPEMIDGIPTDIIESAPAFLAARTLARRARRRPAPGAGLDAAVAAAGACTLNRRKKQTPRVAGISTAHRDVTAGTIAYFCRSTAHGDSPADFFVLSNNHVFANVNQAHRNDDLLQPGPADGGTAADHFAELHRFVSMTLGGTIANKVDAAIGRLLPGTSFRREVCSIGRINGTALAREGTLVRKHGRTTGLTEGEVTDDSYDALVGMDHADPSVVALFEGQLRIDVTPPFPAFGLGGDSGSLVVARNSREAVGLYFAGPPSGDYGIANFIGDVLSELQIELL